LVAVCNCKVDYGFDLEVSLSFPLVDTMYFYTPQVYEPNDMI